MIEEPTSDRMNGAFETGSEAETAYGVTQWIGAILFYLLNLGKRPFNEFWIKKNATKNLIVGYIFNLLVIGGFIYLLSRWI